MQESATIKERQSRENAAREFHKQRANSGDRAECHFSLHGKKPVPSGVNDGPKRERTERKDRLTKNAAADILMAEG